MGDEHPENASASSAHSKVAPDSLAMKSNNASVLSVLAGGPSRIVVVGAVVSTSTVHVQVAGVGSTFKDRSMARAWNVCSPAVRAVYWSGLGHGAKAAPSRAHSKVALGSSLSTAKVAVVLWVERGGPKMMV